MKYLIATFLQLFSTVAIAHPPRAPTTLTIDRADMIEKRTLPAR